MQGRDGIVRISTGPPIPQVLQGDIDTPFKEGWDLLLSP